MNAAEIISRARANPEKFAELVGIILGDGSLSKYSKINHYRLKVTLDSRESEYIQYVMNLLYDLFDIMPKLKIRTDENTADLMIFNRAIITSLNEDFGLAWSPKWNRAIIPDFCLNSQLDIHVLRGYFDTDGCVVLTNNNGTPYVRLEMKISPSPMQKQFIEILKKYLFRFGVYNIGDGKVRIQLNGKQQLIKWINLISFHNQRHLTKVRNYLQLYS